MPKTKKQIRAARQNAKKSTGPKTESGKAASSQNAVKHGIYARSIIIDSPQLKEDPDQYAALLASLQEELHPEGAMQNQLVRIIADCFWRRQRVMAAETAFVTSQIDLVNPEKVTRNFLDRYEYDPDDADDVAHLKDRVERRVAILVGEESIPDGYFAQNLLRYEMRLDRQLTRTYKLLRDLKKQRRDQQNQSRPGPTIPDDAISDRGPFTGLADLEADPALIAAISNERIGQDPSANKTGSPANKTGIACPPDKGGLRGVYPPQAGSTLQSDSTPISQSSGQEGGAPEGTPQKPKNDETNLRRRIQPGHKIVQRIWAKPGWAGGALKLVWGR